MNISRLYQGLVKEERIIRIGSKRIKNYQIFNQYGESLSVNEHPDHELNIVDRQRNELYNGFDYMQAIRVISDNLGVEPQWLP